MRLRRPDYIHTMRARMWFVLQRAKNLLCALKSSRMRNVLVGLVLMVGVYAPVIGQYSIAQPAQAAGGDGHMLLYWAGGAAPAGWTCVSCSAGDDFFEKFIQGGPVYGGAGGDVDHSHIANGSIDATIDVMPARSRNPGAVHLSNNDHSHTFSPVIGVSANIPEYRQLRIIRADTAGDPAMIPAGAIALFDDALPADWTRYAAQDGYYARGENTVGVIGGSNTHDHTIAGNTSAASGGQRRRNTGGTQTAVASSAHTHTADGTMSVTGNEPPFVEMILGELDNSSAPPNNMYAMWDDDPTTDWIVKSNVGGALYQRFVKGAASYGVTGGAQSHAHSDASYVSGVSGTTTTSRTNGALNASDDQHTHTVNVTDVSDDSHLPPYVTVIFAKKQLPSTLTQSTYRWYANIDNTHVGGPLAPQDTEASAPAQNTPFRLRFSVHVSDMDRGLNGEGMKLQVALRSGACDTSFIGESYADVAAGSGAVRFTDNVTPVDGSALTVNTNDPVHSGHAVRAQTYEEANDFTNSQSAIAVGEDGLWDVALVDVAAPPSSTYCFRVVRSSGAVLDTYSVIPEITTDNGDGHMLLFWDGAAPPVGWSCVSCSSGDPYYQKFVRGETSYGGTGGAVDHAHTAAATLGASIQSGRSTAGVGHIRSHAHELQPVVSAASNLPAYRQLQIIRYNNSGSPGAIPAGAVALFDAAVPAGWTRYAAQDGVYIRGEDTVGASGGSHTHTNAIVGTTDTGVGAIRGPNTNNTQGPTAAEAHTHTLTGNSTSVSNEPPYIETILGKISATSTVPMGMIALWDGSFPSTWTSQSDAAGPFNQRFIKPAAAYGATGGAASHTHGSVVLTSSGPSATAVSRTGNASLSSGIHTHEVTVDSFSTNAHLPPYIDVVIAKLTSANVAPDVPAALDQLRVSDSTLIGVGEYSAGGQVQFTALATDPDNPDDLQLCVEVQPTGTGFTNVETQCGTAATYTGVAMPVSVTITNFTDASTYHWQARIVDGAGAASAWVSYGGNTESAVDFIDDSTEPSGAVYDGTTVAVDVEYNDGALDSISANWGITDTGSGVALFEYAVGTTIGGVDVVGWTANGSASAAVAGSVTLTTSDMYFYSVRTTDVAGNQSIIHSDGQRVAPTLTFSSTPGEVAFGTLNSANNFSSTKTTTLTTSTNAYNGYVIRAFASDILSSPLSDTVGFFDGGTYASPAEWLPAHRGYGYTSSDTSIQGSNKFSPAACAGGGSPPCYASFSTAAPGDIVADHTALVLGSPVVNENFIITHKAVADAAQPAGTYTSEVTYVVTAAY